MSEASSPDTPDVDVVAGVSDGAYSLLVADFADTDSALRAYEDLRSVEDGRTVAIEGVVVVRRDEAGELDIQNPTDYPTTGRAAAAHRNPVIRAGSASEAGADRGWASLTDGELRVVALVAQGMSNRRMAEELHLSRHTIDAHLKHVYLKLDIHTRVELTVLALRHRLPIG